MTIPPPTDLRARGSRHGSAKLSDDAVREIRRRYMDDHDTFAVLADAFGVSQSCIGLVLHGETWAHVE